MDGEKTLGIGVLIWLAVFLAITAASYFGLYENGLVKLMVAVFAGLVSYRLSNKKIMHNFFTTALWFGIAWSFIVILLDVSITYHFFPQVVTSWGIWIGHLFIIVAPIIHFKIDYKQKKKADPHYHPYKT